MLYESFKPDRELQNYISRYLHGFSMEAGRHELRIPPSGGIFISLTYGDPLDVHINQKTIHNYPRVFIGGQLYAESPLLTCDGMFGLIGIEFTPTGFYKMFGLDSSQFTDNIVNFKTFCPEDQKELYRYTRYDEVNMILELTEKHLINRPKANYDTGLTDRAIDIMLFHNGNISIAKVAASLSVSTRTLGRLFSQQVGLSPKNYSKIIQLNAVFTSLAKNNPAKIQSLANEYGYFDHSHFIRDFRRFIGAKPKDFLQSKNQFLKTYLGKKVS